MAFQKLGEIYHILFTKYLGFTNTFLAGGLLGLGDAIQQQIELYFDPNKLHYDYRRTFNMTVVGWGYGYPQHFYYSNLDKFLPGTSHLTVFKKIVLDEILMAPSCLFLFLMGMNLVTGEGAAAGWKEYKLKLIPIWLVDLRYWPPVQAINFYFVSPKYRVLYICIATMFYNVFLSYAKHHDYGIKKKKITEEGKK